MADVIHTNPQYTEYLRSRGLLDLRRLLNWSAGECVGEHGPREVWRITLPDRPAGEVYYLRKDRRIAAREIVGDLTTLHRPTSRCFKTFRAMSWLGDAGIGTMKPVCLIERRCCGLPTKAAAIVTAVPGRDLPGLLRSFGRSDKRIGNPPARTSLLYALGRQLWQLGRAKLTWPDAVAKHFYVTLQPARPGDRARLEWRFALIDVENMRQKFNAGERTRQIDQLLESLTGLLTATDVLRIMIGCVGLENVKPRAVRRKIVTRFFPHAPAWIARAKRDRALLKQFPDNRPLPEDELFVRTAGMRVNMRFRDRLEKLHLADSDSVLTFTAGSELYKPGLAGRYRYRIETRDNDHKPLWLYLKRSRHLALKEQISRILSSTVRHSIAWHERTIIKELSLLRIPGPVVVAYAEKMVLGYERASALITEGIVGQTLEKFVPKHFSRPPRRAELSQRRRWIRQLADLIRRFHHAGYCHRDLYFSHIIISFQREGKPIFYLIDLARSFKMKTLFRRRRWIVKDLAAMNYSAGTVISRTDRMRFLLRYLGTGRLGARGRKLATIVMAKTRRIARHDAKHRRVTVEHRHENRTGDRTD